MPYGLLTYKGFYKTASATPGLLKTRTIVAALNYLSGSITHILLYNSIVIMTVFEFTRQDFIFFFLEGTLRYSDQLLASVRALAFTEAKAFACPEAKHAILNKVAEYTWLNDIQNLERLVSKVW